MHLKALHTIEKKTIILAHVQILHMFIVLLSSSVYMTCFTLVYKWIFYIQ